MSEHPLAREILLIAADWHSRTLILGELQEAGYDVMALPGLRYGLKAILRSQVAPRLVIADVWQDDFATPERVADLIRALPGVPIVLLTGVFEREAYASLSKYCAAFMVRPLRIGDVLEKVQSLLEGV
jgi:DNA-binding NtrC family response regulator